MKIPIILLNYNSSEDCRKCISFLKRQTAETEIVVVDNDSPCEGEKAVVGKLCLEQGCTFIQAKENHGYNAGNNIGLRYAAQKGYKYAMIANPDMEFPQEDYVEKIVGVMDKHIEVAVCGTNILGANHERQNPWRFSTFWKDLPLVYPFLTFLDSNNGIQPPQSGYCDILMGCCLMVRLDYIVLQGYFDENVFLFCEEAILGKQVRKYGKKAYYLHEATAIHRHIESHKGSIIKRYKAFEKSRWYYLKNYSGYNKFELSVIYLTRKVYYCFKMCCFHLKGIV